MVGQNSASFGLLLSRGSVTYYKIASTSQLSVSVTNKWVGSSNCLTQLLREIITCEYLAQILGISRAHICWVQTLCH